MPEQLLNAKESARRLGIRGTWNSWWSGGMRRYQEERGKKGFLWISCSVYCILLKTGGD